MSIEGDASIRHVSETALWVAYHRAMETKRRNALFRDPYAALLAGRRGEEIAHNTPYGSSSWATVVRTFLIDEIIMRLVREDAIDSVLNLGAGLDTRPYRLPLPSSLTWIEVDLPGILTYKEEKLTSVKPVCHLRSVGLNLAETARAKSLFAEIGAEAARVLVLSEGLLGYMTREDATGLAENLHKQTTFNWWLLDLITPALAEWMSKSGWGGGNGSGEALIRFAPKEGSAFFAPCGWQEAESHPLGPAARRLGREMPLAWLWRLLTVLVPKEQRETHAQPESHVVLLRRAAKHSSS